MKIAIVRKDFIPSQGGGERYAVNLSEELARLGHDVHVFAHTWEKPTPPGITFHKVPTLTLFSSLKNLLFAYNCRKLLAQESFDIIYSLSQTYFQDVYRMGDGVHRHWLRIQTPHPLLRLLELLTPRQQIILWLEKKTFHPSNYTMIVSNSHLCKRHAIRYFRVPEQRICVVYNGVDHMTFHPGIRESLGASLRRKLAIPENAFVLLFVARNFQRKGLHHLIEALPLLRVREDSTRLLVVGRGDPSSYRKLASKVGCNGRLLFAGETDSVGRFYGVGDVLVLPTLYDPFSNACLEALACGIPVITTQENGAAEIIKPPKTGMVIPDPSNREELAEAISYFLSPHQRGMARTECVQSVRHLTIQENVRQTLEVFCRVLAMKERFRGGRHGKP